VSYVVLTLNKARVYLCLRPEWVEQVLEPSSIVPHLHLQKRVLVPARILRDGQTVAICHETKVDCVPYVVIFHKAKVVRALFVSLCLVFTRDDSHVAKLTRVDLSAVPTEYNYLLFPEEGGGEI
jgi:hypothetical protein